MMGSAAAGPFVVVGMGRSGTSYVSSALHAAGVDMGASLKTADEHNPQGYYEDLEATRMHEAWLARRGLNLASTGDVFPLDVTAGELAAITAYVTRRDSPGRRWGVKAPGILFFWNAWRQALPASAVVVVPFRHPTAVAESFERYGLDRSRALDLWLLLNSLSLYAAETVSKNVFLDFDDHACLAKGLQTVIGPFADTYAPALRHHLPRAEPLSAEFAELHAELMRRSGA
jgi:hypothetical protein